jgi:type IV secretion system protein VirB8
MLDQVNKNIQRFVDSGKYFEDAKQWYASKYLFVYSLRTYVIIFFVVIAFATKIMYDLFEQESSLKLYPFPIYAYDTVNYFPKIKPISTVKEPINVSVARYLSGQYVVFREGYTYNDFQGENRIILNNKIRSLSSRKIYREFLDYVDPSLNPDSPQIKYKNKITRTINVLNVELFGKYELPEGAKVTYETVERERTESTSTKWVANIKFTMLDLEKKDEDGNSTLSYTVTNYKSNKL